MSYLCLVFFLLFIWSIQKIVLLLRNKIYYVLNYLLQKFFVS